MAGKSAMRKPGAPQTFKNKKPPREVGIDDDVLTADLHEKTGVSDEGDAEFSVGRKTRLVGFAAPRSDSGVTHQSPELCGAFTKGRIAKRLLNHPATEPEPNAEESN